MTTQITSNTSVALSSAPTLTDLAARLDTAETRLMDAERSIRSGKRKLRVTWVVSTLAALATLTIGWHKNAIAQGYGITLAQAATRIAALETKTASITTLTDPNTNQPTVRFTGVNVQVVSGSGSTEGTVNGTGNLILGYNEVRSGDGVVNNRTGSHNLVVGPFNDYSGAGGAVIGYSNAISNYEACVIGGFGNTASGLSSTVSGGSARTAPSTNNWVAGTQSVQ